MFPGEGDSEAVPSGENGNDRDPVSAANAPEPSRRYEPRGENGGLDPEQILDAWFDYAEAKGYVRVGSHRREDSDLERIQIIEEETDALLDFSRCAVAGHGMWLPRLVATKAPTTEGHEHRVFMLPDVGRVVKVTWPGQYGRWEHSPSQYLKRWILTNQLAPALDVRFHDFVPDEHGKCSFVMSMVLVPGRHPTSEEADSYLRGMKFERYNDGRSTTLDYHDPITGLILRDCHPRNWIRMSAKELAPIDIVPEMPCE